MELVGVGPRGPGAWWPWRRRRVGLGDAAEAVQVEGLAVLVGLALGNCRPRPSCT